MKKTQRSKEVKPKKMSMGLDMVDDDNINHEVDIMYRETYGGQLHTTHPMHPMRPADMLP